MKRPFLAPSGALRRDPSVAGLLGSRVSSIWFTRPTPGRTVIGWGDKRSGRRARKMAARSGAALLILEDGFLRSVGRDDPRIGVVFDDRGIYYDAKSDSRLFRLIPRAFGSDERQRAQRVADRWRALGLSKYNDMRGPQFALPDRYVLVVDQVRDDLSISAGQASYESFERMLEAALDENPDATILVKVHPDAAEDPRKRHFAIDALAANPRVQVVSDRCHVAPLIASAEKVYTVTSQVGFEALIWGKPVRCFGMPFYAGWGLTGDELDPPPDRETASLEQLVHAALIDYARYWNPVTRQETDVEGAMELIGLNRALRSELPAKLIGLDFSPWKRPFIRQFVSGSDVRFESSAGTSPDDEPLLLWGRKPAPTGREDETRWVEDGFLRSVGLGAGLVRPLSLVIDGPGIYYDATRPSRLETYLAEHDFSGAERARAAALRKRILDLRLTKYNLAGGEWRRPDDAGSVLLVVGQVADDASIRFGSPELRSGGALLRRVRDENPDAYIVYKPHPDVVAGLRDEAGDDAGSMDRADEIVTDVDPIGLIDQIDEVHVMTSLMGFETLLRGKAVVCHGLPFYAGWGVTEDRIASERRGRTLALDELVYGALIHYPRYFSQRAHLFAPPEDILDELRGDMESGAPRRSPLMKLLAWGITRVVKKRGP